MPLDSMVTFGLKNLFPEQQVAAALLFHPADLAVLAVLYRCLMKAASVTTYICLSTVLTF